MPLMKHHPRQVLLALADQLEDVQSGTPEIHIDPRLDRDSNVSAANLAREIRRLYDQDDDDGRIKVSSSYIREVANMLLADSDAGDSDTIREIDEHELKAIQDRLSETFGRDLHDMVVKTIYENLEF